MKQANKHDFSGSCAPERGVTQWNATFSVGVFQWIHKSNGKNLKKSTVKVRIKGLTSCPEAVYDKAREICAQLDAGTYAGKKNVTVIPF